MAACGSLQHIFDKPLDPPPPLFDPCTHITSMKPVDASITDVFSGLNLSDTTSSVTTDLNLLNPARHRRSVSLSSVNSESLSEAIGFESFDDVERSNDQWEQGQEHRQSLATTIKQGKSGETKRSRISGKEIPPPISSIGRRVCFKSYRYNGRLVLKEVRIPTQELLHAYREDGRLKLQFVHFDDEIEIERGNGEKMSHYNSVESHRNCDEADHNTEKKRD